MPLGAQNVIPWHSNLEMSREMVLIKLSAFVYQSNNWVSQIDSTINSCNIAGGIGGGANDNDSTYIDADVGALGAGSG